MGRKSVGENPFQPGAGAPPPVLAGRDSEVSRGAALLDVLAKGRRPSRGLLFFGPRGNGKTTLLGRIAQDARRRGMRAESLPASSFADRRELMRLLREKAGIAGARVSGAQVAGFGVSTEPGPPTEDMESLFTGWVAAARTPLVVLLDEAHTVEPEAGRPFFAAVQEATMRSLPFVLLAAGTPDAPRRLRQSGTFTERALERVPVGRLERSATLQALVEPAVEAGRPVRGDAARLLAEESQDYPYFIQLLGSAAWDAAGTEALEITVEAARRGAATARPGIGRFYSERIEEARTRGVHRALRPLAALVAQRDGQLDDDALDTFLGRSSGPEGEGHLLDTLKDLGVLWQTEPGVWEMGIPSFADHLLARRARGAAPLR